MIESNFNIHTVTEDGNRLIYNLLHQKQICLPNPLYEKLNVITKDNEVLLNRLKPFWSYSEDEDYVYRDYLLSCLQYQSTRLNITLMMTMDCNFRCIYCFERTSDDQYFSKESINVEAFCTWLIELVKRYSISEVSLCFHGGEPMLALDKICEISSKLKVFFKANHIFFLFTMVTNGYLLSPKNVRRLVEANVSTVQITIDGNKETHDKRRFLLGGAGTFTKIIDNIRLFPPELKLYLNVVYGHDTCYSVPEFFDYLIEQKLQEKVSLLVLSHVKPAKREGNIINESDNIRQNAIDELFLAAEAISRDYKIPCALSPQVCTIKQKNSFVVHPSGDLYKCISGIGNKRFHIGSIFDAQDPFDRQYRVLPTVDETCKKCKYSTICNQGCAYEASLLASKNCQKRFFDYFIPGYLKLLASAKGSNILWAPEQNEWMRSYSANNNLTV